MPVMVSWIGSCYGDIIIGYLYADNSVKGIVQLATQDCSVRRFLKVQ